VAAEEIRAAGGVAWRGVGVDAQVLLVHRPKYDDWSLPKGKVEPGEHVLVAAVREVAEETGLAVRLGRRLPPVRYQAGGVPKRVDFWVATAAVEPAEFIPNHEVDQLAWVAVGAAASRLTYQRDAETVAAYLDGPSWTAPLILLRHAAAGSKSAWHGSDGSRPLDAAGEHDATALAGLLRCFGEGRVVSAPAERCLATVRPYAAAVGGGVEVEPAFAIADRTDSRRLVASEAEAEKAIAALAAGDEPVIICAHRENLPVLLAAACAELGAEPQAEPPLRTGEFLVLHRARGRLAAVERYHPAADR
jgi:8-oxo-dGTP diphosphatase